MQSEWQTDPNRSSPVEQIRRVFEDNLGIIFVISPLNICCGYSVELSLQGDSNEYPQHIFSRRTVQNCLLIRATEDRFFAGSDSFLVCKTD